ncbi:formylglycine-generating enzyme family protein [Nocardia inohanensis]|uniref:formylglycine-generating enzyme family protein n=1 Tax=Nocardia inohanensis TaxID=209246 RepID=UPI0008302D3E|nr:SUMF1/EgtB/PvdO family nonheme iron enzyme [Nocardia inohanensis]
MRIAAVAAALLATSCSTPNSENKHVPENGAAVSTLRIALANLIDTTTVTWDCKNTFTEVVPNAMAAEVAVKKFLDADGVSESGRKFVEKVVAPQVTQFRVEGQWWQEHCGAPGFDETKQWGYLFDSPWGIQGDLLEWGHTLLSLSNAIADPSKRSEPKDVDAVGRKEPGTHEDLVKFRDCQEFWCSDMVPIPTGSFQMGGTIEQDQATDPTNMFPPYHEFNKPVHRVNMAKRYAIADREVTVGDFKKFTEETGHFVPEGCRLGDPSNSGWTMQHKEVALTTRPSPQRNWLEPGFTQTDDEPVVCIRRQDAQAYAEWLSDKTGQTYRLPTEAEWEYAARAGAQTAFFWGDSIDAACDYASVNDLSTYDAVHWLPLTMRFNCHDNAAFTAKVKSYRPNAFGLHDVLGNAREFVSDCWNPSFERAPADGSRWDTGNCWATTMRGGGWAYWPTNVTLSMRDAYYTTQARSNMWGMRLVREL